MEFILLKYQQEIFTINKSKLSYFQSAQRDQLSFFVLFFISLFLVVSWITMSYLMQWIKKGEKNPSEEKKKRSVNKASKRPHKKPNVIQTENNEYENTYCSHFQLTSKCLRALVCYRISYFFRFVSFGALAFHILIIHHATPCDGYRYIPFFYADLLPFMPIHSSLYYYLWFVNSTLFLFRKYFLFLLCLCTSISSYHVYLSNW